MLVLSISERQVKKNIHVNRYSIRREAEEEGLEGGKYCCRENKAIAPSKEEEEEKDDLDQKGKEVGGVQI